MAWRSALLRSNALERAILCTFLDQEVMNIVLIVPKSVKVFSNSCNGCRWHQLEITVEFNKINLYARSITGGYANLPSQLLRFGALLGKTHAELNNKPMLE
ncbi:MAG TPA: hypothetical protein VN843_08600 [Anaerolineales bacterium]|nr:hypothetical protein [Anaerolineales bacterium]